MLRHVVALLRGCLVRCPNCGGPFMRGLRLLDACGRCHLDLNRGRGRGSASIGALTVNIGLGEGAALALMVTWILLTLPNPPWEQIEIWCVVAAVALPVLFFPVSRTLWLAIDLAMEPIRPSEHQSPTDAG